MDPLSAAAWANQAYENDGKEWAADRGFSYVLFQIDNHQCVYGKNGYESVVAFRGTEITSLRDLKTNLISSQVKAKGCRGRVHKGYHSAVWQLIPLFKHLLTDRTYFVGHSMGAALATIAGAILKPTAVYSFNSPKAGNATFAKHYPVPIFRMVSNRDIVQGYPSSGKEWVQVGAKISLESSGHSMDHVVNVLA